MSEKHRFERSNGLVVKGIDCIDVNFVVESEGGMNSLFLWACVFSMPVVARMD